MPRQVDPVSSGIFGVTGKRITRSDPVGQRIQVRNEAQIGVYVQPDL